MSKRIFNACCSIVGKDKKSGRLKVQNHLSIFCFILYLHELFFSAKSYGDRGIY